MEEGGHGQGGGSDDGWRGRQGEASGGVWGSQGGRHHLFVNFPTAKLIVRMLAFLDPQGLYRCKCLLVGQNVGRSVCNHVDFFVASGSFGFADVLLKYYNAILDSEQLVILPF